MRPRNVPASDLRPARALTKPPLLDHPILILLHHLWLPWTIITNRPIERFWRLRMHRRHISGFSSSASPIPCTTLRAKSFSCVNRDSGKRYQCLDRVDFSIIPFGVGVGITDRKRLNRSTQTATSCLMLDSIEDQEVCGQRLRLVWVMLNIIYMTLQVAMSMIIISITSQLSVLSVLLTRPLHTDRHAKWSLDPGPEWHSAMFLPQFQA